MKETFKQVKSSRDILGFRIVSEVELLNFLYDAFPNRSRNSVKSILRRGQVSVNGRETTQFDEKLHSGDFVTIVKNEAAKRLGALVGIHIIYEDDDVLIIDKDEGILSVPTDKGEYYTVHQQMMDYVKHQHPRNRIFIVHRLDQDTSGIMILAKTEEAKNHLQNNWQEVVPERTYLAIVEGDVKEKEGTIKSHLLETRTHLMYSSEDGEGLEAITHYKKLESKNNYTFMEVGLETGRKNQIRVHMKDIGHPVVGDKKYGAEGNPIGRLGLHAQAISFIHPRTGRNIRYEAKTPTAFKRIMK